MTRALRASNQGHTALDDCMFYAGTSRIPLSSCCVAPDSPSLPLSHSLSPPLSIELVLNCLFTLFPQISYKEQTLLRQTINKGASAALSPPLPGKIDLYLLAEQHKSHIHTLN